MLGSSAVVLSRGSHAQGRRGRMRTKLTRRLSSTSTFFFHVEIITLKFRYRTLSSLKAKVLPKHAGT